MRTLHPLAIVAGLALGACNGPANAGRDLLDPWRASVGLSSGVGVRANWAGLVHTGLNLGIKPHGSALGVKYGEIYGFQLADSNYEADPSSVYVTKSTFDGNFGSGSYKLVRESYALFPALLSWVDSAPADAVEWRVPEEGAELDGLEWIWSSAALERSRFGAVHAFDAEVEVSLFLYVDLGISPGEIVDFFLGVLTGLDIALDDGRPR